ncbi:toxin HipA [Persicobacter diffluens]|uniref:Toxin HipA n=2 Tax=Persicobacter diffluens TaxID=981 RepID=A0AAN4W5M6_9BACT|nr:toxin HipA [Persicobacter diffluens]
MEHVKTIKVMLRWSEDQQLPVGELVQYDRRILFKYHPEILDRNLSLSPIKLPLTKEVVDMSAFSFDGLAGVFNDSLPDGWGRLLLDRKLTAMGLPFQQLTPLDRLTYVGQNGPGALVYYPEMEQESTTTQVLLEQWEHECNEIYDGASSDLLESLFQAGGSSGGARPKVNLLYKPKSDTLRKGNVAEEGEEHWLIKFPSSLDMSDISNVEYAYYLMAQEAGIFMSPCRLFFGESGKPYFGTKRFDRIGNHRLHMHSASGLMHDNFRLSNMDYGHLMDGAFQLQKDVRCYEDVLRLATFNIFGHNRDDHSKNFSFLMDQKGTWTMAPAYDLTFSNSGHGFHSTMVAGESQNPGSKHIKELAKYFSVNNVNQIIEQVKDTLSNWPQFANQAGVTEASKKAIAKTINGLLVERW